MVFSILGGARKRAADLYSAASNGDLKGARKALEMGADINKLDPRFSETALHAAAANDDLQMVDFLLAAGATVNLPRGDGRTALMQAAEFASKLVIDHLLVAGADINLVQEETGLGVFAFALNRLQMDIARHLLACGAKPVYGNIETLPLAVVEHGDLEFIKAIEARGGSVVPEDMKGRVAFVAARNPDGEVLDYVLAHGADVNHDNDFNYTPLLLAVLNNHVELVKRYLARGDDPDALDIDRETALSLAIENEYHEIVRILRTHGAQRRDYPGLTDEQNMLQAAQDGALGTILKLRDAGVSLNVEDGEGNTPLMRATRAGHLGVVRSLYHLGADIDHRNPSGASATSIANELDDRNLIATMKEFVAEDAIPEEMRGLPLAGLYDMGGMMFGRLSHPFKENPPYGDSSEEETNDVPSLVEKLKMLRELIENAHVAERLGEQGVEKIESMIAQLGARPDVPEEDHKKIDELIEALRQITLSQLADEVDDDADESLVEIEEEMSDDHFEESGNEDEDEDAVVDADLLDAVRYGDSRRIRQLIRNGTDVNATNSDGVSALSFAMMKFSNKAMSRRQRRDNEQIINDLLDQHPVIGTGTYSPLHVAVAFKRVDLLSRILRLGADANQTTDGGTSALLLSLLNPGDGSTTTDESCAEYLLDSGCDPTLRHESGVIALHVAALNGCVSIIKRLLDMRPMDVDTVDAEGNTPLICAAQMGQADAAKLLLDRGADRSLCDKDGKTAKDHALEGSHTEVAALL